MVLYRHFYRQKTSRAHYQKLPAGTDLADLPLHGIVEAKPSAQERGIGI